MAHKRRSKASATKQLGKAQRAVLVRLLSLSELAKKGRLSKRGGKYRGQVLRRSLDAEEYKQFGLPYAMLKQLAEITNFRRTIQTLEERHFIESYRSEGGHRTHIKLTRLGSKEAKRYYLGGSSKRGHRDNLRKTWEVYLGYGPYETWTEERREAFEAQHRLIVSELLELSRGIANLVGVRWQKLELEEVERDGKICLEPVFPQKS